MSAEPEDRVRDAIRAHEREREEQRYERLEELGRGGMAVVYRALDRRLGREVALKVLRDDLDIAPENLARFRREAQAAARLSHPNVVTLHDAGEDAGRMYIAMEWVRGMPLSRMLDERLGTRRQRLAIIEKVARGVHHAHERGIVHRDLKPGNVLVGGDGEPKVADFGIAHLMGGETAMTRSGALLGTPLYMAPEQAEGRARDVSPRTDIYALGAMLYELLAGRPPHTGESTIEVFRKIAREDPVPPRKLDRSIAPELETIALKAIEKEPDRRYASAAEFADDLRRHLEGKTIRARPPSLPAKIARKVRRHRTVAGLAALLVAVIAGGAVMLLMTERAFRLSLGARQAVEAARMAIQEWENQRYGKPHDVSQWRQKLRQAIPLLERALETEPQAHPVWAELGWACLNIYDLDRARRALEEAVRLDPSEGCYRYRLGRVWTHIHEREWIAVMGRPDGAERKRGLREIDRYRKRAEAEFDAALKAPRWKQGKDWEKEYAQAYILLRTGRLEEARLICKDIARRHTLGGEEALILLAEMTDDLPERMAILDQAVDQARSYASAYASAARARFHLAYQGAERGAPPEQIDSLYQKGAEQAGTGIEIDGELEWSWLVRANLRLAWGYHRANRGEDPSELYRQAFDDCTTALRLAPARAMAWKLRGRARNLLGHYRAGCGQDPTDLYRQAIEEDFTESIRLEPAIAEGLIDRGDVRLDWAHYIESKGGDPDALYRQALEEDLAQALRLEPQNGSALRSRANALNNWGYYRASLGDDPTELYRASIEACGAAIRVNPESAWGWTQRGRAHDLLATHLREEGKDPADLYQQAQSDFAEAVRLNPGLAVAWMLRATSRVNWADCRQRHGQDPTEQYREAIEKDFPEALRLNPASAETWMLLGSARTDWAVFRQQQGRDPQELYGKAIEEDLAQAIRRNPSLFEAWRARGLTRANWGLYQRTRGLDPSGMYREAVQDLTEAIRLNPKDVRAWSNRGEVRRNWGIHKAISAGDPTELFTQAVEEDFAQALRLAPKSETAWQGQAAAMTLMGIYQGEHGKSDEAAAWFDRAEASWTHVIELNPGNVEARWRRGWQALERGRPVQALADFEEAVRRDPSVEPQLREWIVEARRQLERK